MERAGALINRLQEQYQQNAGADKMLVTIQILAAELEQEKSKLVQKVKGVSIVAPSFFNSRVPFEEASVALASRPVIPAIPSSPVIEAKPKTVEEPVKETPVPQKAMQPVTDGPLKHDPFRDIPTFAAQHNKQALELNETIGNKEASLNEKLKTGNVELGSILQSSPVKDLKKAIGINDRYVFLNDLFRGDEVMYERSIKTINAFTIFAEAEYWIKRELKLKLGWNENAGAVQQFDQLVRRRFS